MRTFAARARAALLVALVTNLVGCGPSPFIDDDQLSGGGRWYVLYARDGRTSVIEGVDAIRAVRDQLTVAYDWQTIADPTAVTASLSLVHDGRVVASKSVVRPDRLSVGNAAGQFVPLTTCHVTLRPHDVLAYMRRFRSGRTLIDAIPSLPFDGAFTVTLPDYAVRMRAYPAADPDARKKSEMGDDAVMAAVEKRVRTGLARMFPHDRFDVRVDQSLTYQQSFADAAGYPIGNNDGTIVLDDRVWAVHGIDVTLRASSIAFYRRASMRKREIYGLAAEPDVATAFAPTIARLERSHPSAPKPIALDGAAPSVPAVAAWEPETSDETYWVEKPPC